MSHLSKLLIGAAIGTVASAIPAHAQTRVVSNVASIKWNGSSGPIEIRSNRVDVAVQPNTPPIATAIYRINAPGEGQTSRIDGTTCTAPSHGNQGVFAGSANPTPGSETVGLVRADSFTAGQPIAFGVNSPAENLDPNARDSFEVTVRTDNGDLETLRLREDANNSGFFVGYLPTMRIPPALAQNDCRLSVVAGRALQVTLSRNGTTDVLATANVSFLVDPFGIVFDSGDGAPVPGSRVTLINVATGQPASVFGDDGVSTYPNSVITGSTVTDSGGQVYTFPTGDYRFPFVAPGTYRLLVEPPAPYTAPSTTPIAALVDFRRPDNGAPYTLNTASYGAPFQLFTPAPVRIDIPVDQPNAAISVSKTASTTVAVPGEAVQYRITVRNGDARRTTGAITVTDDLPRSVRLRAQSMRYNGLPITANVTADGRQFTVLVPALNAGQSGLLTYIGEIRPDARPGDAVNYAAVTDSRGSTSNRADNAIRIRRDVLGDRIVIIGRVMSGGCSVDPANAAGIGGVRVMMQDGSFTVTDAEGRYHFEGVRPGLHVVQIDPSTLPSSTVPVNCTGNVRAADSHISRFVEGRGGELKRADFHATSIAAADAPDDAVATTVAPVQAPVRPAVDEDTVAAGSTADFFTGQTAGIEWLFPAVDHNPRSPSIRVAIKYLPGQRVELSLNGRPVSALNYDGAQASPDSSFMVGIWRGVEVEDSDNHFVARVLNADGSLAQELRRTVHYSTGPMTATFVRERSLLLADGLNRPVIAIRLTDRNGRPVKSGMVGEFIVAAPHRAAMEVDTEQARQLAGMERRNANWHVVGDDGIAYIELEPTTASGSARLSFTFRDEQVVRSQELDVWLNPGDRPWTIVGFAAGTIGYNTLDDRMEPVAEDLPGDNVDGRIALYAKGRVLGQWLMTMSYDSDREADDSRFGGVIDPRAYYTIYADRADRGFDAASVRNLYLRLERPQFYALFGDFETAINEPQLTRYQRSMNGVKAEYRGQNLAATAFIADTPYRYRRDEMQGSGLSGPYQLGARDVLANSERVTIEVRDRLHAETIVQSRTLTRHIDYDIDYFAGTLTFREPILSRDSDLNPQFIVTDYEVDGVGQRVTNAGGRASWTSTDGVLRIGATAIHDETDSTRSNMGGIDVRYRPTASTEIRAEAALSNADPKSATAVDAGTASAWLIEAEHHGSVFDLLAYARQRDGDFGVGQLSSAGEASRKFGLDGTVRLGRSFTLIGSAWQENFLDHDARRRAARVSGEWRTNDTTLRAGLIHASDELADGSRNMSTLVQLGGTQRLAGQKLELDAQTEFALGGNDDSVDFPARHRLGARFNFSQNIALVGTYEIASGGTVDARTARIGFDVRPWDGARITASGSNQELGEFGPRSFAAYGLSQSIPLSENITFDATVDGQRTLSGISASDVLDLAQPVASGGYLSGNGAITEDFTAVTAGATFRNDDWSITSRGEYRDGEITDRFGITLGAIRRIADGRAWGSLFSWTKARSTVGTSTETASAELSWAHRPIGSRWSVLNKLEFRLDQVQNAVAGTAGPIGGPALTISGDAHSNRVINSMTINYTPLDEDDGVWHENGEYTLFWGVRYSSDRFGADDVAGWSTVVGADWRYDINEHVGIGASGNARIGTNGAALAYAAGPQIVVTPMANSNLVLGYNFAGYHDRDFEESRYSRDGIYATFRLKFDQTTLAGLGL